MPGCAVADIPLVGWIGLGGVDLVALVVVDQQQAVLIDTCMLVTIELTDLATLLHAEEVLAGAGSRLLIEVEVSHLVDVARQLHELRFAHAPVDSRSPSQGGLCQHVVLERHLDTGILGRSHVHEDGAVDEWWLGSGIVVKQILRAAVEIFHATTQAAVEGHEIESDVKSCRLLPCEIGIGVQRGGIAVDPLAVD